MLKLTCLVLLMAVAISWSHVEAQSNPILRSQKAIPFKRAIALKREVASEELKKEVKQLLAGLLLLTVDSDNSAQVDQLTLAFKEATEKSWHSIEEYIAELAKIYGEVTGEEVDLGEGSK